jgi:hypothetical protein
MRKIIKVGDREIRISGRALRIAQLEGDGYEFLSDPKPLIEQLRKCGERIDLFTFMQKIGEPDPKYRYPMEWDNFAAVPVTTYDQWWSGQITPEARNRARQAGKRGVVIREVPFDDTLVKGIWELYNESPVRQGRRFTHFGKDIETVRREEATFLDSSFFIGAFLGEKMIGFVKLTADETRSQANLMNILSTIEHREKAPTNALIAQSVKACAERGIGFLVYQSFTYGKKQWDGIMRFKQVNGFKRYDLPRYYVPLTLFGRAAFRLKFHHRFVDRLPEPVVAKVRQLRNEWNNRKFQPTKETA